MNEFKKDLEALCAKHDLDLTKLDVSEEDPPTVERPQEPRYWTRKIIYIELEEVK